MASIDHSHDTHQAFHQCGLVAAVLGISKLISNSYAVLKLYFDLS